MINNPTIKDVAKEAEVSVATVSRVINGADNVNPKLSKKVLTAIQKLNYKPNLLARGLKNKSTHTIGIVISDLSNPFYMTIAKSIENIVESHNYTLIICSTDDNSKKEYEYLKLLYEKRVDGLIISSTGKNEDYLYQLAEIGLPIVLIDRRPDNKKFDAVYVDKVRITYEIANYLYQEGHRRISLVSGPKDIITNFDRFMGYTKAFYDLNIAFEKDLINFGEFSIKYGQKILKKLLKMANPPSAIISGSSIITEGIMIEANSMGVKLPEEISLITFGELPLKQLLSPKLTYIEDKAIDIGQKAGDLILKRINNFERKPEKVVLDSKIIYGDSVKNLMN